MNQEFCHSFAKRRRPGGFTLVEVGIAMLLMGLVFLGVMQLFISTTTTALRTSAQVNSSLDAANALQRVGDYMREASYFDLPDDNGSRFYDPINLVQTTNNGLYQTTLNGTTVDTGIQITFPQTQASVTVLNASGTATPITASSHGPALYDRRFPSVLSTNRSLWIYRADPGGVPNASSGTLLWVKGYDPAQGQVNYALCNSIDAKSGGAIEFVRPTDINSTVVPHELQIKLISAYYSLINGQITNESSNGTNETILTGKCVYLRNQETTVSGYHDDSGPTSASQTSGSHWQGN